jgi:hypothetical protein
VGLTWNTEMLLAVLLATKANRALAIWGITTFWLEAPQLASAAIITREKKRDAIRDLMGNSY